jgi:hypothetical protein
VGSAREYAPVESEILAISLQGRAAKRAETEEISLSKVEKKDEAGCELSLPIIRKPLILGA